MATFTYLAIVCSLVQTKSCSFVKHHKLRSGGNLAISLLNPVYQLTMHMYQIFAETNCHNQSMVFHHHPPLGSPDLISLSLFLPSLPSSQPSQSFITPGYFPPFPVVCRLQEPRTLLPRRVTNTIAKTEPVLRHSFNKMSNSSCYSLSE